MADIGSNIRKFRENKHMTQRQLSSSIHVTRATLSNYERGQRLPDIYMVSAIADILGVSVDDLLGRNSTK